MHRVDAHVHRGTSVAAERLKRFDGNALIAGTPAAMRSAVESPKRRVEHVTTNRLLLLITLVLAAPDTLTSQQLTLARALQQADATGYANRASHAQAESERARALGSLEGILPTVRVENGVITTTDPLGAFGFLLSERAVTSAAFDPASLNQPGARSNWSSAVVAEMPLLNADAWSRRSASRAVVHAADATFEWTRTTIRLRVVQAYYGAHLAAEVVRTFSAAQAAANAHVHEVASRLEQGLVTRSDLLQAQLRVGEINAQLIGAQAREQIARRELALVRGAPNDTAYSFRDSLPSSQRIRELAELLSAAPPARPADVSAAFSTADAATRDLTRATRRLLPRVNGFARYDINDANTPIHGSGAWTVGVRATWTPFSGLAEFSDVRSARARASAAQTMAEAADAEGSLRLAASEREVVTTLAQLTIAERAVDQASEAHRLVGRQYAGGLAGITELLGAQAMETQTRLGLAQARVALITAIAARALARGSDPAAIAALEK